MSEWGVLEGDGLAGITPMQRDRARMVAANWVRKTIPQRWDDSVAELSELLSMLGLLPPQTAELSYRTKPRDCGPAL